MAAHVHFLSARNLAPIYSGDQSDVIAPGIGAVRKREAVSAPGVTTATALAGEIIIVANEDGASVLVAIGANPDAAATTATNATSAGFVVPAGQLSSPFVANAGDKVSVKAVS